ncbi:MAG: ParA family protein [Candidatus Omnitrophota bacterium]
MKKIFSFCNQKGGVGKTTSVINIAAVLSKLGYKVLVVDMDSQANSTSGLGEEKPTDELTSYQLVVENHPPRELIRKTNFENLWLIPSNAELSGAELGLVNQEKREYRMRQRIEELKNDFDFILIDCPPSLGLVTVNCLVASDYIIIPLQCEYYALEGLGQLLNTYQMIQSNLHPELEIGGVLLTMADMRTNLTQQVIQEVREYFKEKVFGNVVPRSVKLSEAPSFGKPAVYYDPSSRGVKSYFEIAEEFIERFAQEGKRAKEDGTKNSKIKEEESVSEIVEQPITAEGPAGPEPQN